MIAAPSQTSRHLTGVSGSHLNIVANNSVITPKEAIDPKICNAASGRCGTRYLPLAERTVVSSSETSSRNSSFFELRLNLLQQNVHFVKLGVLRGQWKELF